MVQFPGINIFKKIQFKPKAIPPVPDEVWTSVVYFIAFGFGSGTMPFAPGTFGTLMAVLFYILLPPMTLTNYAIGLIVFIIASMIICEYVSRRIHVHDHPGMCLDEFAGFFVTMFNAPSGWSWILLGFILFRLFDIFKPWPINVLDKHVPGGFGMVLDDVVAGIFSCAIIQALAWLISI